MQPKYYVFNNDGKKWNRNLNRVQDPYDNMLMKNKAVSYINEKCFDGALKGLENGLSVLLVRKLILMAVWGFLKWKLAMKKIIMKELDEIFDYFFGLFAEWLFNTIKVA